MNRILGYGLAVILCTATVGEAQQVLIIEDDAEQLGETRTVITPGQGEWAPVSATAVVSITAPGSYVLGGNVLAVPAKHGIEILASNVTLDLNGYMLRGSGVNSRHGITVAGNLVNIRITNGAIRDWKWRGIDAARARNSTIDNVRVSDCVGHGIILGQGTVADCVARRNGLDGVIVAGDESLVRDSTSEDNDGSGVVVGIRGLVSGVVANNNDGSGIVATLGSTIVDSSACRNGFDGVQIEGTGTVGNVTVSANGRDGILAHGAILDSTAVDNGRYGIFCGSGTVTNCYAVTNTSFGIAGNEAVTVADSTVNKNGDAGMSLGNNATVIGCNASFNDAQGILVGSGAAVTGCSANQNADVGIETVNSSTVLDCAVRKNDVGGIRVASGCRIARCVVNEHSGLDKFAIETATNCTVADNSIWVATVGVHARGAISRIQGNSISAGTGVLLDDTNNIVVRNSFSTTVTDVDASGVNRIGAIMVNPDTAGAWQNLGY